MCYLRHVLFTSCVIYVMCYLRSVRIYPQLLVGDMTYITHDVNNT
jgi:hypothetical protein